MEVLRPHGGRAREGVEGWAIGDSRGRACFRRAAGYAEEEGWFRTGGKLKMPLPETVGWVTCRPFPATRLASWKSAHPCPNAGRPPPMDQQGHLVPGRKPPASNEHFLTTPWSVAETSGIRRRRVTKLDGSSGSGNQLARRYDHTFLPAVPAPRASATPPTLLSTNSPQFPPTAPRPERGHRQTCRSHSCPRVRRSAGGGG